MNMFHLFQSFTYMDIQNIGVRNLYIFKLTILFEKLYFFFRFKNTKVEMYKFSASQTTGTSKHDILNSCSLVRGILKNAP